MVQLGAADHMGHVPKVEVPKTISGHSKIILLVDDNPVTGTTGITTGIGDAIVIKRQQPGNQVSRLKKLKSIEIHRNKIKWHHDAS